MNTLSPHSSSLGSFAVPLIRRVFPQLITNAIVGVQPMTGPVGLSFMFGHNRFKKKIKLMSKDEWIGDLDMPLPNYLIGVIMDDGLITIHWRGKTLKKRLTRTEWDKRFFTEML